MSRLSSNLNSVTMLLAMLLMAVFFGFPSPAQAAPVTTGHRQTHFHHGRIHLHFHNSRTHRHHLNVPVARYGAEIASLIEDHQDGPSKKRDGSSGSSNPLSLS